MAASITSGRMTMPAPPPNGVSSTVRCLSRAWQRMSTVSTAHSPASNALPASDAPSGPGNISGNSVSTTARHGSVTASLPHLARERSEEHTSELQSLMRISYAVFCLKKKKHKTTEHTQQQEKQKHTERNSN